MQAVRSIPKMQKGNSELPHSSNSMEQANKTLGSYRQKHQGVVKPVLTSVSSFEGSDGEWQPERMD